MVRVHGKRVSCVRTLNTGNMFQSGIPVSMLFFCIVTIWPYSRTYEAAPQPSEASPSRAKRGRSPLSETTSEARPHPSRESEALRSAKRGGITRSMVLLEYSINIEYY